MPTQRDAESDLSTAEKYLATFGSGGTFAGEFAMMARNWIKETDRLKMENQRLREALENLASSHDGYHLGLGPCCCAAHEVARQALSGATP